MGLHRVQPGFHAREPQSDGRDLRDRAQRPRRRRQPALRRFGPGHRGGRARAAARLLPGHRRVPGRLRPACHGDGDPRRHQRGASPARPGPGPRRRSPCSRDSGHLPHRHPARQPPSPMSTVALRAAGLTKRYGSVRALDGLDLEVGVGEVHAFLGPNGAGKTTTIRILLGLLRKDGGEVSLLGADPWRDAVDLHRRLAYVPGDVTLWPSLTGGEIIDLLGRRRGGINASRLKALTERFDLDTSKRARAYSRGNRQKVALLAALASDAELLLLDEPTAGLDPLMEAAFRDCVNDERRNSRTILLSSHILSEAEALSDRVTLIRRGKTVETGTLADMRHRAGIRSLTCRPPTLEELFLRHYSPERSAAGSQR